MTTTTKTAQHEKSYSSANLYVQCKEINGRVYWYGQLTLDGLAIKNRANTFGRISKTEAARILAQYGFTTDEFVAEYRRIRKEASRRNDEFRWAIYRAEAARKADDAAIEYAVTVEAQGIATEAEIENAQANDEPVTPTVEPADYTPQVAEWIDPHQYGEPGNLEHIRRTDITEFNAHIGDDIVTYINGKFYGVHSLKYGAYYEIVDGEPRFWTNPYHLNSDKFDFRDADRWCEEDWFDIMIKRGACIIGDAHADDFNSQLAELTANAKAAHAAEKNAMHELDKACDTYHKAEETWRQARLHMRDAEIAVEQFLAGKAKELRDNLLGADIFDATIAIIAQDGKRFDQPDLGQIWIDFRGEESQLIIFSSWNNFAIYDTPAQVTAAIARLKDAIANGATEFKFPTIGELNKPTTANEWRTVRTKTNPRNVNLTVQNKARANA